MFGDGAILSTEVSISLGGQQNPWDCGKKYLFSSAQTGREPEEEAFGAFALALLGISPF